MTEEELISMRQSINSYLGFLRHHDTYLLRKKIAEEVCRKNKKFYFSEDYLIVKCMDLNGSEF